MSSILNKDSKIYIAGHKGMVGTSLNKYLLKNNVTKIITATRKQLNLQNASQVDKYIKKHKREYEIITKRRRSIQEIIGSMFYRCI